MYRSIADAVIQNSRRFPGKIAAADRENRYTYEELKRAAFQTAAWLKEAGLRPEEPILAECTQDTDFVILDLACGILGAVFVPVEKKAAPERVSQMAQTVGAGWIIGKTPYSSIGKFYDLSRIREESSRFSGEETGWELRERPAAEILFTTGTTGQPKGIVISDAANLAVSENISGGVRMTPDTVELIPLPLSHSHGLRTCRADLFAGGAAILMDGVMNIGLFFKLMEEYQVNALDISPTIAKLLLKIARKGLAHHAASLDYIEIGTAVLEDDTKEQLKTLFPRTRLYNFYGSTEAGRSCVLDFNEFDDTGCIGYPSRNASFFVVDDEGRKIESSKENPGLLAVSGRMMMNGYFGSEELTKATLKDGVLYTSDLGYIDEAGRIYVLGRKDDVINYKGIKIAPEEIEQPASKYPGVKDCCCVPVEDAVCGQVPKLYVLPASADQFDKKAFLEYLKKNLEPGRMPASVELIDQIPRSSNGKLQRKKLRER